MRRRLGLTLVLVALASAAWGQAPPTPQLDFDGLGPIRIGMKLEELRRVAGPLEPNHWGPDPDDEACWYTKPRRAPDGVAVMIADGIVVRIDVDRTARLRAFNGIGIGDPETALDKAFETSGLVFRRQHFYLEEGGGYLLATGPGANVFVFETERDAQGQFRISTFRAGRLPEIILVEGCS